MLANSRSCFHQMAYVTADMAGAKRIYAETYGVTAFHELTYDTPDGKVALALANVGGMEIELIQPLVGARLYADVLVGGDSALVFHHAAIRIEGSLADWDAYAASLDPGRHPVVLQGAMADDLRFLYTDERTRLGHYVEHLWFSPELRARQDKLIPRFP